MWTISRLSKVALAIALGFIFLNGSFAQDSSSEIHQLFLRDQQDRGVGGKGLSSWEELDKRDRDRRDRVRQLIDQGQLKTGEDFHDAAFICQHGDAPADYLFAHILAVEAIRKGNDSRWIAAATLDRYLQSIKQPQVFGTQYSQVGNVPYTQDPYDSKLFSDQVRADFCVPSIDEQKKNVKAFDSGQYPSGILPPGCAR